MNFTLKNDIKIEIREATINDAQKAMEFFLKVNAESNNLSREPHEVIMTLAEEEKFISKSLESNNSCFFVAIHECEIIGSAGFQGSNLARINHRVSLGISVLQDYYNLGIGSILMEKVISKAKELQKLKIELDVRSDNYSALYLYEKYGFKLEGVRRNGFYVNDKFIDLTLMGLELEEKL